MRKMLYHKSVQLLCLVLFLSITASSKDIEGLYLTSLPTGTIDYFKLSDDYKKIKELYNFIETKDNILLYSNNNKDVVITEISTSRNSHIQALSFFDNKTNKFNTVVAEIYSNESFPIIKTSTGGLKIESLNSESSSSFIFDGNKLTLIKEGKSNYLIETIGHCVGRYLEAMSWWEFGACMATSPICMTVLSTNCAFEVNNPPQLLSMNDSKKLMLIGNSEHSK